MSSLRSSRQRQLTLLTVGLSAATFVLGSVGLFLDPALADALRGQDAWGVWAVCTDVLFSAASLLAFSQPSSPPTNFVFGAARLTAIGFGLAAASTVILGLSRSARLHLALRRTRRQSATSPHHAHAVVIGAGPLSQALIRDITTPATAAPGPRASMAPLRRGASSTPASEDEGRPVIAHAGWKQSPSAPPSSSGASFVEDEGDAAHAVTLTGRVGEGPLQAGPRARLHLDVAKEVFITGPEDAVNLDVAGDLLQSIRHGQIQRPAGRPLTCYVHVGHPVYASLLRAHDLFQAPDDPVDFQVFNVRERAARELLLDPDRGLATHFMPGPDAVAHYVVVGFGAAGQAVALEAARLAHFSGLRRPRMTIIDDFHTGSGGRGPAGEAQRQFLARYPAFCPAPQDFDLKAHAQAAASGKDAWAARPARPACRQAQREAPGIEYVVNAEFLDRPAEDPDLAEALITRFTAPDDTPVRPAIVVCFDDDGRSFRTAYRLKELFDVQAPDAQAPTPIFVYLPVEDGLAELIEPDPEGRFPLYAFGSRRRVASYAQVTRPKIQALARRLHANYRRHGGDAPPWDRLPYAFRLSNEDAAAHAAVKLRTAGYRWQIFDGADRPGSLPAQQADLRGALDRLAHMEHNRFVAERLLSGWRYEAVPEGYEQMPDEARQTVRQAMKRRKRRPSLAPFDALLAEDVPKDRQQIEALPRLLGELGETLELLPNAPDRSNP